MLTKDEKLHSWTTIKHPITFVIQAAFLNILNFDEFRLRISK